MEFQCITRIQSYLFYIMQICYICIKKLKLFYDFPVSCMYPKYWLLHHDDSMMDNPPLTLLLLEMCMIGFLYAEVH